MPPLKRFAATDCSYRLQAREGTKMSMSELADWSVFDERGERKYLTDTERMQFLAVADKMPKRKRALLYLLVYSGCRISEALNCRPIHLDPEHNILVLTTLKRRKRHFRCIPVPSFLTLMLLDLECARGASFWTVHRVTAWRWVKAAMTQIELDGPMATCKGMRHGFGVWAATQSVPQNVIQRWMGHADPTTTAIYLNVVGNEERIFAERMWHSKKFGLVAKFVGIQETASSQD